MYKQIIIIYSIFIGKRFVMQNLFGLDHESKPLMVNLSPVDHFFFLLDGNLVFKEEHLDFFVLGEREETTSSEPNWSKEKLIHINVLGQTFRMRIAYRAQDFLISWLRRKSGRAW